MKFPSRELQISSIYPRASSNLLHIISFSSFSSFHSFNKQFPACNCFARAKPYRRRYANEHGANILQHEYAEYRFVFPAVGWWGAWYRELLAHAAVPLDHPFIKIQVLVEQATQVDKRWEYEESAVDENNSVNEKKCTGHELT